MFGLVWTVALTVALPPPRVPPRLVDEAAPKLVIKEKDYFLHALPPPSSRERLMRALGGGEKFRTIADGLVLLHTSITTGEMKVLAAGGTTVSYLNQRNNPRPDSYQYRIAGVAADKERLYVLRWHKSPSATSSYLLVFRPDNGELTHTLELKGDAVPTEEPKETADRGPLRHFPDGVGCFGTRFKFRGTELIEQSAEKKP